ncbi:MAG: DNA-processing protein DprA [Candidatus Cloacimonetes bacterium]|nr:DNA-processing protein DprA [Candidatus Cloacimonadota bacterium]
MIRQDFEKIRAWIKLQSVKNVGISTIRKITETIGDPSNFIDNPESCSHLKEILSPDQINSLKIADSKYDWKLIEKLIDDYEIKFLTINDKKYPALLRNIYSPPPFIFYRGELKDSDFRKSIAVVGTRKPSNYGKLMTKKIIANVAINKFTIISGLAYGIDTIAHQTALENNGRTIAILGTGCEQIYPAANQKLADEIINSGALISEQIPGAKLEKWFFPMRNRIISGMSLGVFVVEGAIDSGALLTAKIALSENKDLFALPGDINRSQSVGPNYLIANGAKIVTGSASIIEEYDMFYENGASDSADFPELDEEEKIVYDTIIKYRPEISIDELHIKTGIEINQISSIVFMLELKSVIKRVSGGKITPLY